MHRNTLRAAAAAITVASAGGLMALLGLGEATAASPNCNVHQNVVATVETDSAAATICQWQGDGKLEYRGITKSSGDEIALAVTAVVEQANHPGLYSYTAENSGFTYRVDDKVALAIVDPEGTMVFYERQI
ncbi:hypothetical protein WKY82_00350 [Gordonia malaquae]|uniref:hypothetical protein n=1 Tax=Gordonia malaquae TaxID=410332 RepID=UPI0030C78CA2